MPDDSKYVYPVVGRTFETPEGTLYVRPHVANSGCTLSLTYSQPNSSGERNTLTIDFDGESSYTAVITGTWLNPKTNQREKFRRAFDSEDTKLPIGLAEVRVLNGATRLILDDNLVTQREANRLANNVRYSASYDIPFAVANEIWGGERVQKENLDFRLPGPMPGVAARSHDGLPKIAITHFIGGTYLEVNSVNHGVMSKKAEAEIIEAVNKQTKDGVLTAVESRVLENDIRRVVDKEARGR